MQIEMTVQQKESKGTFVGRLRRKPTDGSWTLSLTSPGDDFKSQADAEFAVEDFKSRIPSTHAVIEVEFI